MSVESPMISGGSALAAMRSLALRGGFPAGIAAVWPARGGSTFPARQGALLSYTGVCLSWVPGWPCPQTPGSAARRLRQGGAS